MQLKYSNYVAFSHFHGKAVNNSGFLFISSTKAILRDHGSNPSVWLLLWQNFDLLIKYVTYMCLNI